MHVGCNYAELQFNSFVLQPTHLFDTQSSHAKYPQLMSINDLFANSPLYINYTKGQIATIHKPSFNLFTYIANTFSLQALFNNCSTFLLHHIRKIPMNMVRFTRSNRRGGGGAVLHGNEQWQKQIDNNSQMYAEQYLFQVIPASKFLTHFSGSALIRFLSFNLSAFFSLALILWMCIALFPRCNCNSQLLLTIRFLTFSLRYFKISGFVQLCRASVRQR